MRAANRFATGGLVPDLTLLLEMPVGDGLSRAAARSGGRDRMERAEDEFHGRVAAAFARFADPAWQREHPECGPIALVDARGSEEDVAGRILQVLAGKWPETFAPLSRSHLGTGTH